MLRVIAMSWVSAGGKCINRLMRRLVKLIKYSPILRNVPRLTTHIPDLFSAVLKWRKERLRTEMYLLALYHV